MPVSPTPDEAYYWEIAQAYQQAELEILSQIRDRLARGVSLTDQEWATARLAEVQVMRRDATQALARVNRSQASQISATFTRAYSDGGVSALRDAAAYLPGRPSAVSSASRKAAVAVLARALSGDLAGMLPGLLRKAEDDYRSVVASAVQRVAAGGVDRNTATSQALQAAFGKGLRVGPGGRMNLPDYVQMAVRTGTANALIQGHLDTLADNGVDLVFIHPGPRHCDRCDVWGNRPLHRGHGPAGSVVVESSVSDAKVTVQVYGSLEDAKAQGWGHPNCRCSVGGYFPGVTRLPVPRPPWDQDGYEAQQGQRGIERQIRGWKTREALTVDPLQRARARDKVAEWQKAQRDHLDRHPALKRQYRREQPAKVQAPDPEGKDFRSMTNAEKLEAARRMYGTDSAQYRAARKRWAA